MRFISCAEGMFEHNFALFDPSGVCTDFEAEKKRVEEVLDAAPTGTASGMHYFWSNRARGRVLAILRDRTWRAALALEGCRSTLARVHWAMFPHNPQPSGVPALLTRFREGKAIKTMLRGVLVDEANIAFAYLRTHRPNLPLERVTGGLPASGSYAAKKVIDQV